MSNSKLISGFSKLSKAEKLKWVVENFLRDPAQAKNELKSWQHQDEKQQRLLDGFSENTISNFPMPYGIAPNFLINDKVYAVPMVIEESSVVAAASSAAKYWLHRGGFRAEVLGTKKIGQIHFSWKGQAKKLESAFEALKKELRKDTAHITANMEKRGGGILDIELLDLTAFEKNYYQLKVTFDTKDSMGANFINSVLEEFAKTLDRFVATNPMFRDNEERDLNVIMSILSNYTPECLVRAWVECPVDDFGEAGQEQIACNLAHKFAKAVRIAQIDPYRAVTHNKGIFNGIDAVVLATANDFRAVEACGHAYAARSGQYRSLSSCSLENGMFRFQLDLPLALGTVGGLTKLHPLAKYSLELLGHPSAEELMKIVACAGLAQNFAAVRSLVTTGIQQGHMKMHLANILNHIGANELESQSVMKYFEGKIVSFTAVRDYLLFFRGQQPLNLEA